MKKAFLPFLFVILVAGLTACNKEETDPDVIMKNGISLTGAQQVPAVSTSGSGELNLQYRKSTRTLTYTITWIGLTSDAVSISFHGPASPGEVSPPALSFTGIAEATTGNKMGSVVINEENVNDFLTGKWYLNIQTVNHPAGEVRGQVQL